MNSVLAEIHQANLARRAKFFPTKLPKSKAWVPPELPKPEPAPVIIKIARQSDAHMRAYLLYRLGHEKKITEGPKCPTVAHIVKTVAEEFDVTPLDIYSDRRTASIIMPRHIAMYLSRHLTTESLPSIGRRFGRDHTTAIAAIKKIDRLNAAGTAGLEFLLTSLVGKLEIREDA